MDYKDTINLPRTAFPMKANLANREPRMLKEWEDIHEEAKSSSGVLSTEINHAVGEDSVLVHHVLETAGRSNECSFASAWRMSGAPCPGSGRPAGRDSVCRTRRARF